MSDIETFKEITLKRSLLPMPQGWSGFHNELYSCNFHFVDGSSEHLAMLYEKKIHGVVYACEHMREYLKQRHPKDFDLLVNRDPETKEQKDKRRVRDDAEIRELDKEAYTWSVSELQRLRDELKKDFGELLGIANEFEDTPTRQKLFDFCFKLTCKISIIEHALESAKKKGAGSSKSNST